MKGKKTTEPSLLLPTPGPLLTFFLSFSLIVLLYYFPPSPLSNLYLSPQNQENY